jgi:hypothetical protein
MRWLDREVPEACEVCGARINDDRDPEWPGSGNPARFCGPTCRQRAHRARKRAMAARRL